MKKLYTNTRYFINIILLLFVLNSCDSFVDVDLPKSQLNSSAVFQEYMTANTAITDIYSKIRDKGFLAGNNSGLSNKLGNYTDEMVPFGNPSNTSFNFYYNSVLATTPEVTQYWNYAYNQIYAANEVIEGVSNSTGLSPEQKNQLTGEALFIRALSHFYLVNLYGDIPFITQTDYRKNSVTGRMPIEEVFGYIIKDLENASILLTNNYSNLQRVRPNRYVVKALLARTYLYSGAYAQASNEASSLINQTGLFKLEQDLNRVFLISSSETIWQLQSANPGKNTEEGLQFIFQSTPPPVVALSTFLVNSFSQDDLRKSNWLRSRTNGISTWFHPFKYKEQNNTPSSLEYSIVFRLAEQYLIRAEARAHQGDLIGAREDLNRIRNRAGLQNTVANNKEELLTDILKERRLEFFSEHGHRFFDLKRFNLLDSQLSVSKPGWKTSNALFPIPQNELLTNPNLGPQNPGY
ncbi:RagB/SusD family nutrient uptake outer membrane protein [Flavobacterium aquidurense]|uniref:RagB/SusD family nutrient uptake outer membrane protein n=1 Tax=Flavobacterium aquidurense TaxID=362413 RepID=UPI0028629CD5|nr:RagB/SusD family nutrient uptake outer membrane protein [Flavobacterium aquidurense]MDR7371066.1 hypothetical protein [Flavobacterium aquidurense]